MGRHFNLMIWILMFKAMKGQVLFNDLDDNQQNSLDLAMYFIKNELLQLTKDIEKLLVQKLEEIEGNLQMKISTGIENVTQIAVENFTKILENKLTCCGEPSLL